MAEHEGQLHEPEQDDIRTVRHPDTPYTSATSFDELPLAEELLQVLPLPLLLVYKFS